MEVFANRLKELRKTFGISQKELAKKCGLSLGGIQGYEQQVNSPISEALIKLANFFNVSTDYLLGLSDIPDRR